MGIKAKGENRTQYVHAIDMVPTVLEVLGIEPPESIRGVAQSPIEGLSCGYDFGEAVSHEYHAPFTFTGVIHQVTVDLSGELITR